MQRTITETFLECEAVVVYKAEFVLELGLNVALYNFYSFSSLFRVLYCYDLIVLFALVKESFCAEPHYRVLVYTVRKSVAYGILLEHLLHKTDNVQVLKSGGQKQIQLLTRLCSVVGVLYVLGLRRKYGIDAGEIHYYRRLIIS